MIEEGDKGDSFYFVENGKAEALRKGAGKSAKKVKEYFKGDYFGEIALLRNVKRQASIRALSDLYLMSVDKGSFERLLGPLDEIMQRNMNKYHEINKKLGTE